MSSDVDKIKERLGIAEVIGSYLKLQKAGKNLKAICPFHNEKTPSFFVSPDRDSYYCFGCNARGDIFTFVQEFEGLDFSGALKLLAPKAGVTLKTGSGKNKELDKLYLIIEESSLFFEKNLKKSNNALNYIKGRGITLETVRKFRIGFALDSWDSLIVYLKKKGFMDKEMERVGLLKKSSNQVQSKKNQRNYDTFRNRVIFPTFDSAGRIVAFSGRILGEKDDYTPKYLNSPETVLFNKSRILYGYSKAKQSMKKSDYCILVEGQVDLVMSHQAGFVNTVALSGTGFTIHHADLIKKITDKMIIAFDADDAGINSAKRASELALLRGIDVKIVKIPLGKDPADIILKDKIQWKNIITKSSSSVEFFIDFVSNNSKDQRDFWKKVRSVVLPLIARIQNNIDKSHFVSLTSSKTGIPEEAISDELKKVEKDISKQTYSYVEKINDSFGVKSDYEENIPFLISKKDKIIDRIKSIILWQRTLNRRTLDIDKLLKNTEKLIGEKMSQRIGKEEDDVNKLIFEAETIFGLFSKEEIKKETNELLKYLKEEILKENLSNITNLLKNAENRKNEKEVEKLLKQHRDITLKIQKNRELQGQTLGIYKNIENDKKNNKKK